MNKVYNSVVLTVVHHHQKILFEGARARACTGSSTYDHPHLQPQKYNYFFFDPVLFPICTSKIINQAAVRTITMGASGNTGLAHTQASSLSLTYIQSLSSICCMWCIKKINCIKMIKRLERLKNTVNKYMTDLQHTSQN
jgi:hypothetical protein